MRRQLSALARFLLGILTATKFEFVIDLQAVKQIGLTIPVRVLGRANQVIK